MKYFSLLMLVFLTQNVYSFDNIYVRPTLDSNVEKFLAYEVVVALNSSVEKYNLNRKNHETIKKHLVNESEKNIFDSIIKNEKNELLEIKYVDGQYTLSNNKTIATFNAQDLMRKQFYLNGQLVKYKNHTDLSFAQSTSFNKFFSLIISQAHAGLVDDNKSNRLIFASIVSLNNIFEDAGIVCNIKCDTMKINFQKLVQRINHYNGQCDTAKNEQDESFEKAKSINYYSSIKVLSDPSFNEGVGVSQLLAKMNQISAKEKDVTKILDGKFKSDFNSSTCEKQLAPFLATGLSNLSAYANLERDGVDTVSIPKVCGKINSLKQCLDDLYTANKTITQTMKAKGVYTTESNFSNLEGSTSIGK